MNQQHAKVVFACLALALGAGLVAWQLAQGKPSATEDMVLDAFATRDINVLKQTRLNWARWIESAENDPEADQQKLADARDNLAKLDALLIERGVEDPASITSESIEVVLEGEK